MEEKANSPNGEQEPPRHADQYGRKKPAIPVEPRPRIVHRSRYGNRRVQWYAASGKMG